MDEITFLVILTAQFEQLAKISGDPVKIAIAETIKDITTRIKIKETLNAIQNIKTNSR